MGIPFLYGICNSVFFGAGDDIPSLAFLCRLTAVDAAVNGEQLKAGLPQGVGQLAQGVAPLGMGFILAARRAGRSPKIAPTRSEKRSARRAVAGLKRKV